MDINLLEFTALATAHFTALLSPGPDFILIVGTAMRYGFRRSVWTSLGIACANAVYIVAAIFGFSLLRENQLLFISMKLLAAVYLCYLGWCLLSSPGSGQPADRQAQGLPSSSPRLLCCGFLSAILNPKNAIFYLSLMSLIVSATTPLSHQLLYGLWMFSAVLLWDLFITWSVGNPRSQQLLPRHSRKLEKLTGIVLILVASLIVL